MKDSPGSLTTPPLLFGPQLVPVPKIGQLLVLLIGTASQEAHGNIGY